MEAVLPFELTAAAATLAVVEAESAGSFATRIALVDAVSTDDVAAAVFFTVAKGFLAGFAVFVVGFGVDTGMTGRLTGADIVTLALPPEVNVFVLLASRICVAAPGVMDAVPAAFAVKVTVPKTFALEKPPENPAVFIMSPEALSTES
jgi:hypothetical protein